MWAKVWARGQKCGQKRNQPFELIQISEINNVY